MKSIFVLLLCAFIYMVLLYRAPISDDLGVKIRKLDWVKSGGCGYVVFYISNYLDSKKVKYQIIQVGFGRYKNIHYMIKVDNIYMDYDGSFSRLHPVLFLPHRIVSKEYLRYALNDVNGWNKNFNRSDTIRIKEILNN